MRSSRAAGGHEAVTGCEAVRRPKPYGGREKDISCVDSPLFGDRSPVLGVP